MPALMALGVSKGNKAKAMGSVMAILTMGHSLGMIGGSLLAGLMMDMLELRYAFPIGGGIMLICVAIFVMLQSRNQIITHEK